MCLKFIHFQFHETPNVAQMLLRQLCDVLKFFLQQLTASENMCHGVFYNKNKMFYKKNKTTIAKIKNSETPVSSILLFIGNARMNF
jgi:hypothetical protein